MRWSSPDLALSCANEKIIWAAEFNAKTNDIPIPDCKLPGGPIVPDAVEQALAGASLSTEIPSLGMTVDEFLRAAEYKILSGAGADFGTADETYNNLRQSLSP